VLKSLPVGVVVVLILKGPEGYTTHLETRFNQDGTPKTVRITKPILHSESFIGRIRKTFSAGASGRSCRTKQTQANCECHKTLQGDEAQFLRRNGDLHSENQCLDKSQLSQGSKGSTTTHSTSNEPNNSNTNLIRSTKSSESNKDAISVDTVSHINDTVSNNNSHKILSTDLQKENEDPQCNTGKSASINGSDFTVNNMDIMNKEQQKKCNNKMLMLDIKPLKSGGNKNTEENATVSNDDKLYCNGNDTKNNSVTKLITKDTSENKHSMVKKENGENVAENGQMEQVNKPGNKLSNENSINIIQSSSDENVFISKAHHDGKVDKLGNVSTKGSPAKKFVKLRHVGEERPVCTDTLHQKAIEVRSFKI
jgi:hypothetical protein